MNILDHLNASYQFQNKLDYRKAFLLVMQQLAHLFKKNVINLLLFGHWYFFPPVLICLAILNTKNCTQYVVFFSRQLHQSSMELFFLVTGVKES